MALCIASAARKRGWKGTGAAGGAVLIAEAIAERLRAGAGEAGGRSDSGVSVAPNGFINLAPGFVESVVPEVSNKRRCGVPGSCACVCLFFVRCCGVTVYC